ncbi:unnamed protein product [Caenorhabditis bovis]|uniref:KATNIP domain-containing protein n=1 Tax=Caenorhabditis bovis TaxID=2654633 RepID=A0A8S1F998_9PELO|nr:unnamed protein product [Caenorhabditis bovis]
MSDDGDLYLQPIEIPELPCGSKLAIRLLSNWGDPTLIGLNSIEIFTDDGTMANVGRIYSNATDVDGNIESLLSEVPICKDTQKMWNANMITHNRENGNTPITITIEMAKCRIAMIRFWNYNASRVRAQIGVRHVELLLDDVVCIFRGEIDCAFSADSEFEPQMGDTVLFTTDERILEAIAEHDVCLLPSEVLPNAAAAAAVVGLDVGDQLTPYRPTTSETKEILTPDAATTTMTTTMAERPSSASSGGKDVKLLHIELLSNWGMRGLIGLTGIEIIDENNQIVDDTQFTATVTDGDASGIRKLFNGKNLTRNADEMWLSGFGEKNAPPTIVLSFASPITVKAISFWNYNASFEMSYAGAKLANVYTNGKLALGGVVLRKATGFVYFDFVQDVVLVGGGGNPIASRPHSKTIGGFVFQLRLLSTWGDEYYIGLNGVELYDDRGRLIDVKLHNLAAFPESVNILPSIKNDLRVSDNLINGINDTDEARHMWLTALLPNRCARVFFVFDAPTYVAKIVVYNYRKTPERGVRHVSVTIDDLIVFSGEIPASTMDVTAKLEINLRDI